LKCDTLVVVNYTLQPINPTYYLQNKKTLYQEQFADEAIAVVSTCKKLFPIKGLL